MTKVFPTADEAKHEVRPGPQQAALNLPLPPQQAALDRPIRSLKDLPLPPFPIHLLRQSL